MTSYEERYKEGYVARAFRFMTKPLNLQELAQNLNACVKELQLYHRIPVTVGGLTRNIPQKNILYFAAQSGGSEIRTISQTYFHDKSLLWWENTLTSPAFFRCHKKYLVNLHHITELSNHTVTLITGEKLPVSRRKWTAMRLAYMKFDITYHH